MILKQRQIQRHPNDITPAHDTNVRPKQWLVTILGQILEGMRCLRPPINSVDYHLLAGEGRAGDEEGGLVFHGEATYVIRMQPIYIFLGWNMPQHVLAIDVWRHRLLYKDARYFWVSPHLHHVLDDIPFIRVLRKMYAFVADADAIACQVFQPHIQFRLRLVTHYYVTEHGLILVSRLVALVDFRNGLLD